MPDTTARGGPAVQPPPRTTPPWGQENLDYVQSEENTHHLIAEAERAAPLAVDLWLPWTTATGQLTLHVWTGLLLQYIQHTS